MITNERTLLLSVSLQNGIPKNDKKKWRKTKTIVDEPSQKIV